MGTASRLAPDSGNRSQIATTCVVCGSAQITTHLDGDDTLSLASVGSSRTKLSHGKIMRCADCGLCFRSFRPRPDQLADLYREADDKMYEAETQNRWKTAQRHRAIVERHHPKPGAILDAGCASGSFLRAMADANWKIYGVEPSASQFQRAKALIGDRGELQQTVLEQATLPGEMDVVTMWDVLEHVADPNAFLQTSASLLRRGGHLILNVPRIDSFFARALGARWPLLLAEHLNYFTIPSLQASAKTAGLQLVKTGSRPSSFSLGYVLYRLGQHNLPLMQPLHQALSRTPLQSMSLPLWLGEVCAVFSKK